MEAMQIIGVVMIVQITQMIYVLIAGNAINTIVSYVILTCSEKLIVICARLKKSILNIIILPITFSRTIRFLGVDRLHQIVQTHEPHSVEFPTARSGYSESMIRLPMYLPHWLNRHRSYWY